MHFHIQVHLFQQLKIFVPHTNSDRRSLHVLTTHDATLNVTSTNFSNQEPSLTFFPANRFIR